MKDYGTNTSRTGIVKWTAMSYFYFYNYRMFKHNFQYEDYLNTLPHTSANLFMKFRLLNHKLPIQKGRFLGIERNERLCQKCNINEIGDEFHYIFKCPFFTNSRRQFLKPYFWKYPNTLKFSALFNSSNKTILKNLVAFIRIILQTFK